MRLAILVTAAVALLNSACDSSSQSTSDATASELSADQTGDFQPNDGELSDDLRSTDDQTHINTTDLTDSQGLPDKPEAGGDSDDVLDAEVTALDQLDTDSQDEWMDVDILDVLDLADQADSELGDGELVDLDEVDSETTDVQDDTEVVYPDIPCCYPTQAPQCDNYVIRNCVCAQDSYCCLVSWDSNCVYEVESKGCGTCNPEVQCGDGTCDPAETCLACPADCGTCESICQDNQCSGSETCSTCPQDCGVCEGSSCCKAQSGGGCDQQEVQSCVCQKDSYCCSVAWDENCVNEVKSFGCGWCAQ